MSVPRRVLVVEDERAIAMTILDRLEAEGYEVGTASDGDSGFERAVSERWDAIVLDLMLPGRDGLAICRELRSRQIMTPILMLTARGQTVDKVAGLRTGADDYLVKPFEMDELIARVEAIQRRSTDFRGGPLEYRIGDDLLDLRTQEIVRDGERVALSSQEFKLLRYFLEHRGEVLDRDELLSAVWGYDESIYTRTVDVHVAWLRAKLGDRRDQARIVTVRGRGYKLVAE